MSTIIKCSYFNHYWITIIFNHHFTMDFAVGSPLNVIFSMFGAKKLQLFRRGQGVPKLQELFLLSGHGQLLRRRRFNGVSWWTSRLFMFSPVRFMGTVGFLYIVLSFKEKVVSYGLMWSIL